MKRGALRLLCTMLVLVGAHAVAAGKDSAMPARAALGTSAAADREGRLWIAYAEPHGSAAHVMLRQSDDAGATWNTPSRVTAVPEPVSADGENRPKLVFGAGGEIYVSWTSSTSAQYTGDIRFARSLDAGRSWSAPATVHADRQLIGHRFDSLSVDAEGRVWVAWIDKRDLVRAQAGKQDYAGAAIYYAYSDDRGGSWRGDFKLADNTCECCRIALVTDLEGRVAVMWRHVFGASERDHAFATLGDPVPLAKGGAAAPTIERVTFDRWRVDACPHHGPSLAFTADGARHAVWFNQVQNEGRVFYGRLNGSGPEGVRQLPIGATHADLAASGNTLAVVWKRFDGTATRIESWISQDGGRNFSPGPTLQTDGTSDQPRVVKAGGNLLVVWRRAAGVAVQKLAAGPERSAATAVGRSEAHASARNGSINSFGRGTLDELQRRYRGSEFWLVLWDLECTYCMKSLSHLATAQKTNPGIKVVTISTDPVSEAPQIAARLLQIGVQSEAFAFSDAPPEALRFAVDPAWAGEKPRAYRYRPDGRREAISGVIAVEQFSKQQ